MGLFGARIVKRRRHYSVDRQNFFHTWSVQPLMERDRPTFAKRRKSKVTPHGHLQTARPRSQVNARFRSFQLGADVLFRAKFRMSLETINYGLALATISMQIASAALLGLYFLRHKIPDFGDIASILSRWGLWIGLLVALSASAVTVIHSGVFGLPPCPLCWWQRAFLYPQVVLFALALWRRDRSVADYSLALSVIGLGIAVYHHILQMYPSGALPCPSHGEVSCAQIFFLEFGYITYPMMAASAFAFIILIMLFVRRREA